MAVTYSLDNRTDKNGDAPIRMSITIKGAGKEARYLTSSGYKIAPDKWNKEKQRVKNGASNGAGIRYNTINAALADIEKHFADYEDTCKKNGIKPDRETLMQEFANAFGRKKVKEEEAPTLTFWDYVDMFTKEMGAKNSWTKRTYQKFDALKHHLQDFNANITFEHLDEAGLNAFVDFLNGKKDLKNSTTAKQLALIKWFMRWATAKGYTTNNAFEAFMPKLKTIDKKVIFLEWEEVMRLFNYEIPINGTIVKLKDANGIEYTKTIQHSGAMAKARDIFLFSCFTSLRFSDVENLKYSNINGNVMELTTVKTSDSLRIELNKYALSMIEKHKDLQDPDGYVFPRLSNQKANVHLKDLCELCGINQMVQIAYYKGTERIEETFPKYALIGTHCGRRTFITCALSMGISAEIVMRWSGHVDHKSMRPYIAIVDAAKAEAMEKFNNL